MKSVGTLCDFIPWHSRLPAQNRTIFIYRRVSSEGNPESPGLTGVLLQASPSEGRVPSCLVYRQDADINNLIDHIVQATPHYISKSENNTLHQFWHVDDDGLQLLLEKRLDQIGRFYPLDNWVSPQPGPASRNSSDSPVAIPTLLVADSQLKPLPCHRLLADLSGMDDHEFLQRLQKCFNIRVATGIDDAIPYSAREFGLYVAGYWYHLRLIEGTWFQADPVSDLDVSVVHDNMITPMLGITDQHDSRIAYTSADCSVPTLQQQVDSGQWQALWLMPAPTVAQLMQIADLGRYMPGNSVCFQPVSEAEAFSPAVLLRTAG